MNELQIVGHPLGIFLFWGTDTFQVETIQNAVDFVYVIDLFLQKECDYHIVLYIARQGKACTIK